MPELETAISSTAGPVSDRETVDALLVLHQNQFIGLGRYVGLEFVPFDPTQGKDFFYRGGFRCRALPTARRRQQELSRGDRNGIFISHISEEKRIALRLQKLLQQVLSPAVPVFVSSDYKSIESGEKWYDAILGGLKRSQVVIMVLSRVSLDRRWINFEAGFGMGQESRVIPVVSCGLPKSEIGLPLSELHARDLHDSSDLRALLDSIAIVCGVSLNEEPIAEFGSDLLALETQIPSSSLEVTVFRRELALYLAIRNTANRPLDMVDAELLIPEQLRGSSAFHSYPPVRETKRYEEDGVRWIGYRLTTQASQRPHLGISPLPATLLREMGEVLVTGLTIGLPADLSPANEALPIRYRVSARQESVGPVTIPVSQLPRREPPKRPDNP
ncbi:MAG: toll/interleukin-1 receptor domain-containing protein [Acidobacteria bacterium]|nr:toll/interleukin-1 receptor domain-containing protein [Acidobacteriota bacterium]